MINLDGNTVLVTGGATGIGFGIVKHFYEHGSTVIVCGRRQDALLAAKSKLPKLITYQCDVGVEQGRLSLRDFISKEFPKTNVLVNNAGIQRRLELSKLEPWRETQREIAINFEAPVHLCQLFLPHLVKQSQAAIINVSSGLSFAPLASVPVYSATKAALHSFTLSLRHQLAKSSISVIEIIPPAVNTDLGGPGLATFGVDVNEFCDAAMKRLASGELEIGFGVSEKTRNASRQELDEALKRMNSGKH